jgi:hypothetical protein
LRRQPVPKRYCYQIIGNLCFDRPVNLTNCDGEIPRALGNG